MDRTEVFISFCIVALLMVLATIAVIRSQRRYDLFKSDGSKDTNLES